MTFSQAECPDDLGSRTRLACWFQRPAETILNLHRHMLRVAHDKKFATGKRMRNLPITPDKLT